MTEILPPLRGTSHTVMVGTAAEDEAGHRLATEFTSTFTTAGNPTPSFVLKWGSQGGSDGQFNLPFGIAVDGGGSIYVSDRNNDRIQKFE